MAGRGAVADQVRFDREWGALRAYAAERGVRLIGDVPIYIAAGSADHRAHPELFRDDAVAGTPPDAFTDKGQLWGNPLYHWPALQRRGYRWWVERLARTFALFDLARIDHFRGFVCYWAVPRRARHALAGSWQRGPGAAPFRAARAALGELPVIAEDLGVITPAVHRLRDELGLPGMAVLQFGFTPGDPRNTHDLAQPPRAPGRLHGHARQRHAARLVRDAARRPPGARRRGAPRHVRRGVVGPRRARAVLPRARGHDPGPGRAGAGLGGADERPRHGRRLVAVAARRAARQGGGGAPARDHGGGRAAAGEPRGHLSAPR